jgi:hypothetical protein
MTKIALTFLNILRLTSIVALVLIIIQTSKHIQITSKNLSSTLPVSENYLPKKEYVELTSIGYKSALSHVLWFKTINYFGKELKTTKNYSYLDHYLNLVISLNPNLKQIYDFGALMLSWEAEEPIKAILILDKAIVQFPNDWYYYYLRGFINWYFLSNLEEAKKDYYLASQIPNAPIRIKSLSNIDFNKASKNNYAAKMLESLIQNSSDIEIKKMYEDKLKKLKEEIQ